MLPVFRVDTEIEEDSITTVQPTGVELELLSYLLDDVESTDLLLESLILGGETQDLLATEDRRDARETVHSYLVGLTSRGLVTALLKDRNVLRVPEAPPTNEEHDSEYWWEITDEGRDLVEPRLDEEGSVTHK